MVVSNIWDGVKTTKINRDEMFLSPSTRSWKCSRGIPIKQSAPGMGESSQLVHQWRICSSTVLFEGLVNFWARHPEISSTGNNNLRLWISEFPHKARGFFRGHGTTENHGTRGPWQVPSTPRWSYWDSLGWLLSGLALKVASDFWGVRRNLGIGWLGHVRPTEI